VIAGIFSASNLVPGAVVFGVAVYKGRRFMLQCGEDQAPIHE